MVMPASERRRWTRDEVFALIDASPLQTPRYELVDGGLVVTPSPSGRHQIASREIFRALARYLELTSVGEALYSPFDVEVEPGTLTQPDVFVVPVPEAMRLRSEMPARDLMLAVEVVSPGSARDDRGGKRDLYQRTVPEYWIIDVDARFIERWRPNDEQPQILRERVEWHPSGADEPFILDLDRFFARVFGEPT
jgi:Uma2 family endonuclease